MFGGNSGRSPLNRLAKPSREGKQIRPFNGKCATSWDSILMSQKNTLNTDIQTDHQVF